MWTYSIEEDYTSGSQIFSVVVDSSNQFSADDQEYSVSFISMGWTGYGKFGRKFREAEYAMPADLTELLVTQIGTFFDDGSVEDSAQITLDLSGLGLNGVAVDLRKLSVHQRPDRDRDLNDGVDSTSFGSVLTTIIGTEQDDYIIGSYHAETIRGGGGNDYIAGGGGTDTVSYADSTDGVIVNLSTGDASGGFAVGDSFIDIENLIGTKNGDQLYGNDGDNVLSAGDGRDHLYGGAGDDTLHGGADQDILKGDAGTNMLFGDGGDDGFLVSEGLDIIDGGAGYDRYDATFSDAGVTINLGDVDDEGFAEASGGLAEGDLLKSIERLIGSHHDDVLTGDDDVNQLEGNMGNDILTGGGGSDVIYGEEGDDIIDGGSGNDVLSGGEGDDIFILNLIDGDTDVIGDFSRGNNKIRIISDNTGSSLADYDIEVRTDTNSFGTVSTYLYLDTNDNGSYDKMILSLTGFTGWDDSLHLDTSVQSDFV